MAAISALMINETTLPKEHYEEERTPTTPRAPSAVFSTTAASDTSHREPRDQTGNLDDRGTELSSAHSTHTPSQTRTDSQSPQHESAVDTMDLDTDANADQDGSDNDTEQGDSGGSRKKKGQRFFCTGYPPCNLSFTRSEHLARHIRKHTGERPFQCHCNRRFSRLDNLRQHAQTVHVNEEIPTDSLAATGTRFQRQIRTDRVRPAGRPRSGTMSSSGTHSRGHSRNLSASSIGSTSSNYSTSTVDPRRRPPSILMADGRPKLGLETPSTPPPQFAHFSTTSPGDIGTPTSTTYSVTPSSPLFGSSIDSPMTAHSRGNSFSGVRSPTRRLSVPSASHPFHLSYPSMHSPYSAHAGMSNSPISSNASTFTSPTSSTFPYPPGFQLPPGEDWRRRTWHPSSYSGVNLNYGRPATSGLTYSQTPDAPQPAFARNATAAAGHAPRLPGIESFDHMQQRPITPPRRHPGSLSMESSLPSALMPPVEFEHHGPGHGHRRHVSADIPRQSRYSDASDRLASARNAGSWVQDGLDRMHSSNGPASKRKTEAAHHAMAPPPTTASSQHLPSAHDSSPQHLANNRGGRAPAFYVPAAGARTSPEDSGSSDGIPTPGTSVADVHPAIMPSSGILDHQHAVLPADSAQSQCLGALQPFTNPRTDTSSRNGPSPSSRHRDVINGKSDLGRLEALVAVATSEKTSRNT